jgi:hypothetical protein
MKSRFIALLFPVLLCLTVGCTPRQGKQESRSAMPSDGKIRVLFTRVEEQSDVTHYKWSFVGDRNWSDPSCDASSFSIAKSSKLNATNSRGACFTWEIDIKSQRTTPAGTWKSKGEVRGSNGRTAKLSSSDGKCEATRTTDELIGVGSTITLGKIGQAPLTVVFTD